jgi:tRNA (mo5U34)-methyltransferase
MSVDLSDATKGTGEGNVAAAVASNPRWYHTIELRDGVVTPGWFDLRSTIGRLPWPDVTGKRCLDVGPYDGQIAFELERRGAREVIAADIGDFSGWDFALRDRASASRFFQEFVGDDPGAGFKIAKRILGSSVERIELSVYDLDPERVGTFDVVTCGSLLLHLRDPVRALEAIRSVCAGQFLSAEQIDLPLTVLRRRTPAARFQSGNRCQWWISNAAGHAALVRSAGFRISKRIRPYSNPYGPGHPHRAGLGRSVVERLLTGGTGVPHAALLAEPEPAEGEESR